MEDLPFDTFWRTSPRTTTSCSSGAWLGILISAGHAWSPTMADVVWRLFGGFLFGPNWQRSSPETELKGPRCFGSLFLYGYLDKYRVMRQAQTKMVSISNYSTSPLELRKLQSLGHFLIISSDEIFINSTAISWRIRIINLAAANHGRAHFSSSGFVTLRLVKKPTIGRKCSKSHFSKTSRWRKSDGKRVLSLGFLGDVYCRFSKWAFQLSSIHELRNQSPT